jgi:hypothetical protein
MSGNAGTRLSSLRRAACAAVAGAVMAGSGGAWLPPPRPLRPWAPPVTRPRPPALRPGPTAPRQPAGPAQRVPLAAKVAPRASDAR